MFSKYMKSKQISVERKIDLESIVKKRKKNNLFFDTMINEKTV